LLPPEGCAFEGSGADEPKTFTVTDDGQEIECAFSGLVIK
jgi:hypothetical protein